MRIEALGHPQVHAVHNAFLGPVNKLGHEGFADSDFKRVGFGRWILICLLRILVEVALHLFKSLHYHPSFHVSDLENSVVPSMVTSPDRVVAVREILPPASKVVATEGAAASSLSRSKAIRKVVSLVPLAGMVKT